MPRLSQKDATNSIMQLYNVEKPHDNVVKVKKWKFYSTKKICYNFPIVIYRLYNNEENLAR